MPETPLVPPCKPSSPKSARLLEATVRRLPSLKNSSDLIRRIFRQSNRKVEAVYVEGDRCREIMTEFQKKWSSFDLTQ
ncbi:unnamed protein product, partial [Nesidiocoris tenuis]